MDVTIKMTLAEDIESALQTGALSIDELMRATDEDSRSHVCDVLLKMRAAKRVRQTFDVNNRGKTKYAIR